MLSHIRLLVFIVALPMSAASLGASLTGDVCAAYSQANMHACLKAQAKASAAELAAAEKSAESALTQWDEGVKYRTSASAALKKSNKAFIQFRQAQCSFTAALGGGAIGNALALRQLACISDLNRMQAAFLKQAISDLPTK